MIIEIHRVGFLNKGSELMLLSIIEKIKERYPKAILVMEPTPPTGSRPYYKLAVNGIYLKAWLKYFGIQWGHFAFILPKKLRKIFGIVLDKEVDVVLDAAGFSYSDQWGIKPSKMLLESAMRWKKNKTKVILLPQAFGPFKLAEHKKLVNRWIKFVDLVFVRDSESCKHLIEAVGEKKIIKQYPDFTNLIEGKFPKNFDSKNKRVALVPNFEMINKTSKKERDAYISFMTCCARHLVKNKAKPFFLIHGSKQDKILVESICEKYISLPVVEEDDTLQIKGILGNCDFVIGSRFHALVSALSQGVPSLCVGWSHKYKLLFSDYDISEYLMSVFNNDIEIKLKLDKLIDKENNIKLKLKLNEKSKFLKDKSLKMWKIVFDEIDNLNI